MTFSEWVFAYKLELERTFKFGLHHSGKEFWSVPDTGTCSPKSTPLLIMGAKVDHPYSPPALSVVFCWSFSPTCTHSSVLFCPSGWPGPSRPTRPQEPRVEEEWPVSLHPSMTRWERDTLPALSPAATVGHRNLLLGSVDPVVKCFMCA